MKKDRVLLLQLAVILSPLVQEKKITMRSVPKLDAKNRGLACWLRLVLRFDCFSFMVAYTRKKLGCLVY